MLFADLNPVSTYTDNLVRENTGAETSLNTMTADLERKFKSTVISNIKMECS